MKKAKIEWYVFTDNPQYGRLYLGKSKFKSEADDIGKRANKGKYVVERRHIWK